LQTDQRALENALVTRDQAVLRAKNYIFLPLEQDVEFTSKLAFKKFTPSLDKLISYALLHQPNLHILRRAQETAALDYQAALEPTRPTISVNGGYNYAREPVDFFAQTNYARGWTWTLNANWLFFDSGVTRDQVRQTQIERTVADLNLADGERTTQLNIRNAYLDVIRTEKQIADFQTSRDQARRDVEVLRLRFQNGLDTLLDVFDAENSMRDLDNEFLGLLVQFNESKDSLSEQVGIDVDTL
jgi:outer membrane protein